MVRLRPIAPVLLLLLCLAPLAADGAPARTEAISAAELRNHVRILAADAMKGRRSGKPGGERAAEYVAGRFEDIGLEPGGDAGTWLQWFGLPGGDPETAGSSFRAVRDGEVVAEPPLGSGWRPFSFAQAGRVERAEIVFAGYGIHAPDLGWDDYAGIDVRGKIAIVLRHGPNERDPHQPFRGRNRLHLTFVEKAAAAERAGAVAMFLVNDAYHHPGQPDRCPTRIPARSGAVQIPASFLPGTEAEKIFAAAGVDLTARERKMDEEYEPRSCVLPGVTADLRLAMRSLRTANVIGILPGSDPELADQAIVVGGHYDHLGTDGQGALDPNAVGAIRNGADDNASGTAAVIEVAESFALSKDRPGRTLIFIAFGAEELGLLGSRHYVEHPVYPLERTAAMVNMDMIGRATEAGLFLGGTGTSPVFGEVLDDASVGFPLEIRRSPSGFAPSDNATFYSAGIPCLFFHTGLHEDYHRATDDWDKLDYDALMQIARLARRVTQALSRVPAIPPAPRLGIRLQPSREPGVVVGSAEKDSPAGRAGLKPGDRILAFGDTRIGGIEDLQAALGRVRTGDEVERAGEVILVPVKF